MFPPTLVNELVNQALHHYVFLPLSVKTAFLVALALVNAEEAYFFMKKLFGMGFSSQYIQNLVS